MRCEETQTLNLDGSGLSGPRRQQFFFSKHLEMTAIPPFLPTYPFLFCFFFFLKIIYSLPDLFFFSKFNLCSVCSSFLIPRITVSVFLLMAVLNGDHLFSGSSSSSSLTEIAQADHLWYIITMFEAHVRNSFFVPTFSFFYSTN